MRLHTYWRKGQRSGFATLHFSRDYNRAIQAEVSFLSSLYGFSIETDDERGLVLSLRLGLVCLWLHFEFWHFRDARQFEVSFHDEGVWFGLWSRSHEWRSADPWWAKQHVFRPLDHLLGSRKYSVREVIEERDVEIPMPEGTYPAKVVIKDEQWKRPRWPFAAVRRRAHVEIPDSVPHAGKWGADGLYGMTCNVERRHPIEDAIGKCVASVLGDRWRFSRDHRDTGKRETA
jgi:hypothetical protein